MTTFTVLKDPDAVVDYIIDWTETLNGDTISTSSWTADNGLIVDSDSKTASTTTGWFSGGTAYTYGSVQNEIVTVGGRTMRRTIVTAIQPR